MLKTVLVVDDDASLSELYRLELEDAGYHVLTAPNGMQALDMVKAHEVDAVVLDIRMEGMDGLVALGEILKVRRELPVVINSAYPTFKRDFGSWSADAYVVKSSNLDELKKAISQVLESGLAAVA